MQHIKCYVLIKNRIPAHNGNIWTVLVNGVEHHAKIVDARGGVMTNGLWIDLYLDEDTVIETLNVNPYAI